MTDAEDSTEDALAPVRDFAPKLAELTSDVLFGDVWEREQLSARDRALVTVAALVCGGHAEQLRFHGSRALRLGVTEAELRELVVHLAFYAGWPRAMTAISVLSEAITSE
ncbi:carboxymuconolactone decarboxylase family protein [Nocardioides sp. AE5]|uniref:carboxymuconolactone decarboxylase family protein n=1 Tax=Nocardioides sp. AE5 TaxID=2962573 RepID=UPI0028827B3E|nr:carboxymuconolactone decarboxylase family protein [Nocardioides sp. AE5]MDT0203053.1 carboxymuconolactone decarboxylase family protein [Nocardioides sp. AE5]